MTELVRITPEEEREIKEPAARIVATAKSTKVATVQEYERAASELKAIKGAIKRLEEKKQTLLRPLKEAVKAVQALFAGPEAELSEAENLYKRGMIAFDEEQERKRAEEQRRRDDEARRERERLEREAAEREAAAARSREAGKTAQAERQESKAEELKAAAVAVVAPIVQVEQPKVAGLARRENWYAVVTQPEDLILAVAVGIMRRRPDMHSLLPLLVALPEVPLAAVQPNMTFLNNQAKAMKRQLAYPGVKPAVDKVLASGSK